MSKILLILILFGLASAAFADDWSLVWSDEFEKEGQPDSTKWDYEEGFVRNEESQYYTRARLENARVENGMLVIEGRRESFENPRFQPDDKDWRRARRSADYTSAALITLDKASWRYGRVEVRAKLPHGKGVWPALWMMGENRSKVGWPKCGEIDIMEFVGHDPDRVHATVHFPIEGKKHRSKGGKLKTKAPYEEFHVYALEWTAERMDFFFDGTKYHTFNVDDAGAGADNPFRKPHYLLINLALGGSWGGAIDDANLPQQFLIDYVRVYEKKADAETKIKSTE